VRSNTTGSANARRQCCPTTKSGIRFVAINTCVWVHGDYADGKAGLSQLHTTHAHVSVNGQSVNMPTLTLLSSKDDPVSLQSPEREDERSALQPKLKQLNAIEDDAVFARELAQLEEKYIMRLKYLVPDGKHLLHQRRRPTNHRLMARVGSVARRLSGTKYEGAEKTSDCACCACL